MAISFAFHFVLVLILAVIVLVTVDAKIFIINENNETVYSFVDGEILHGGDDIPRERGLIVAADPLDACSPIKEGEFPHFENVSIIQFVLIFGNVSSSCRANQKIRNADAARYDVAILFDLQASLYNHYDRDLSITALNIGYGSGKIIMDNFLYNKSSQIFWIKVIPNNDYAYWILLLCIVVGVCIIVMVLFMICLLVKCIQERRKNRRNRMSAQEIRQLPTESYSAGGQYEICAICLEEYKEGEKLRILPCSHAYHVKCIDQWLLKNRRTCPLCKRKIKFRESDSEDSSDSELASPAENRPLLPPRSSRAESSDSDSLRQVMRSVVSQLMESGMVLSTEAPSNEMQHNEACSSTSPPCDVSFEPTESGIEEHRTAAHRPNPASTYGSVNNSEGEDEFSDALGPLLPNHQHMHMSV